MLNALSVNNLARNTKVIKQITRSPTSSSVEASVNLSNPQASLSAPATPPNANTVGIEDSI